MPIPRYIIPPNQFASSEESRAGTADNKAVTPRGLHAALRHLGAIPGVRPSFDSLYYRLDLTNAPTVTGEDPFAPRDPYSGPISQVLVKRPAPDPQDIIYYIDEPLAVYPQAQSQGMVGAWLRVMWGDTIGYTPIFFHAIPSP